MSSIVIPLLTLGLLNMLVWCILDFINVIIFTLISSDAYLNCLLFNFWILRVKWTSMNLSRNKDIKCRINFHVLSIKYQSETLKQYTLFILNELPMTLNILVSQYSILPCVWKPETATFQHENTSQLYYNFYGIFNYRITIDDIE